MLSNAKIPILGFVAPSGTGKTQLLKALIAKLSADGFNVAIIKHSHHDFEIDHPGKDSYELRQSGARQMLIASRHRSAMITENRNPAHEVQLNTLIQQLDQAALDIILVEGFKFEHFAKIELYREAVSATKSQKRPMYLTDPDIIAVATDTPLAEKNNITALDINNTEQILEFILKYFSLRTEN
jgi:molybdopterin-guanine dinucleotide biosynthesis protein B